MFSCHYFVVNRIADDFFCFGAVHSVVVEGAGDTAIIAAWLGCTVELQFRGGLCCHGHFFCQVQTPWQHNLHQTKVPVTRECMRPELSQVGTHCFKS